MPLHRYVLFFALAAGGLAADLFSKSLVFNKHWAPPQPGDEPGPWLIDGVLGIETSFNGGALFGMFQGGSLWLAALSLVALGGILIWMFVFKMAVSRWLTVALGLITGGILGNLYDRLGFGYVERYGEFHTYHVRDFIHFRLQGVPFFDPWPNFNIADSLLVTGAAMLFFYAVFVPESDSSNSGSNEQASD